jgi:hypothetical protein
MHAVARSSREQHVRKERSKASLTKEHLRSSGRKRKKVLGS